MNAMERVYQIDQILGERRFVSRDELLRLLGVSWSTLKRDLSLLKVRLHAPIVFDRDLGGYRFERNAPVSGPRYELPRLWFSAQELEALRSVQLRLADFDNEALGGQLKPLLCKLTGLLGAAPTCI